MAQQTGIVNIKGKDYQTVALRVQMFREKFPAYTLKTEVLFRDKDEVVMLASVIDETGRLISTGHAEEQRKSSQINATSALENAETSAIGRALAAFGLGGTEFASANEVENAIHQQNNKPKEPPKPKTMHTGEEAKAYLSSLEGWFDGWSAGYVKSCNIDKTLTPIMTLSFQAQATNITTLKDLAEFAGVPLEAK